MIINWINFAQFRAYGGLEAIFLITFSKRKVYLTCLIKKFVLKIYLPGPIGYSESESELFDIVIKYNISRYRYRYRTV